MSNDVKGAVNGKHDVWSHRIVVGSLGFTVVDDRRRDHRAGGAGPRRSAVAARPGRHGPRWLTGMLVAIMKQPG